MSGAPSSGTFAIHLGGDRRVDALRDLAALVLQPRPLPVALREVCARVAAAFGAEVATVYLREREHLVMRGNVGFPADAIGRVRLRGGEGLTGLAADCLRPVSRAAGPGDPRFCPVPGLGEERYPVFLAVPLLDGAGQIATGVLVVQRRGPAFGSAELALGCALAGTLAALVARGPLRLVGRPVVGGWAVGRAVTGAAPRGSILLVDDLSMEAVLAAHARGVAGIAAANPVDPDGAAAAIARVARLPLIGAVAGALALDATLAILDGDAGTLSEGAPEDDV